VWRRWLAVLRLLELVALRLFLALRLRPAEALSVWMAVSHPRVLAALCRF
jgi:hypothetical protein